jgi:hypothetical protein
MQVAYRWTLCCLEGSSVLCLSRCKKGTHVARALRGYFLFILFIYMLRRSTLAYKISTPTPRPYVTSRNFFFYYKKKLIHPHKFPSCGLARCRLSTTDYAEYL